MKALAQSTGIGAGIMFCVGPETAFAAAIVFLLLLLGILSGVHAR